MIYRGTPQMQQTLKAAATAAGFTDIPARHAIQIGDEIYRQLPCAIYPPGTKEWHSELAKTKAAPAAGAGARGAQAGGPAPKVTLTPVHFDVTGATVDATQGNVGKIDFKFGAGGAVTDADKTLTLTVAMTGAASASETVTVTIPKGTTAQGMEPLVVAAWNAVPGLSNVQASQGLGTSVEFVTANGVSVTGVTVTVT